MNLRSKSDEWPSVALRVLGPARITAAGTRLDGVSRKNLALLTYLAVRAEAQATRDTICGLLWPDSADEQARASLRQALSSIRKALGTAGDAVISDGDMIELDMGKASTDVSLFLSGIEESATEALEATANHYHGDLLEGFPRISPEYDRWLEAERGALRSHYTALLLRLSDAYETEGRLEDMIAVAQKLLSIDPLQEHVHRRLIRVFRTQRRYDAALKQFDNLRKILSDQLGVEPEKPTLDLVQEIRSERRRGDTRDVVPAPEHIRQKEITSQRSHVPVAPARPSIGVLRFRGLPQGNEAELLGEGISEDVTIDLSRDPNLMVISRQSSFHLDEDKMTAREIGEQLGVRFYVSGTVRLFEKQLRVTAHLVSCETGHEVWAERYDRELKDYFQIQSEIARTVSTTAADRIAADLVEQSATGKLEDLESYQLVLKGISEVHRFKAEAYDNAIDLFEHALKRTPDFGRALGWLALSKLYLRWNIDASADFSDITPIAERAVELEPSCPKGHCALAMCNFIHRHFDRAEFNFQSALRANPNDELVLTEYGRYLMYVDRPEDGLQRIREAMRVNPFHPVWFWAIQGRVLHTLGRHEEAVQAFEKVQNPPFYIYAYLAACYAKLGNTGMMRKAREDLYEIRPDFDLAEFKAIFPYKNPETANRWLESFDLAELA